MLAYCEINFSCIFIFYVERNRSMFDIVESAEVLRKGDFEKIF